MADLVVHAGRVLLAQGGEVTPVSAMDVFRVAIRGATNIGGIAIDAPPSATMPDITFRQQSTAVGMLVRGNGANVTATPAIRHHGDWVPLRVPEVDDHSLIGSEWHPLDQGSLTAVRTWLERRGDKVQLSAAAYIELYRDKGPGFEVVDQLDDQAVTELAGGSAHSKDIAATLYPYQATGLQWLSARAQAGLGGILADQMGLGKTLQIIGLLAQRSATPSSPNLIVVPLTLVENWVREFRKFAPTVRVYRHVGSRRSLRPVELARQEVVITTYETAVSDEAVLSLVTWGIVILDEAQAIKNPDALRTKAVNSIPRSAGFAVTGTPLENRTQDVWSLSTFALPGYLGTREEFSERLEAEPERLRLALRPLLLRRADFLDRGVAL